MAPETEATTAETAETADTKEDPHLTATTRTKTTETLETPETNGLDPHKTTDKEDPTAQRRREEGTPRDPTPERV